SQSTGVASTAGGAFRGPAGCALRSPSEDATTGVPSTLREGPMEGSDHEPREGGSGAGGRRRGTRGGDRGGRPDGGGLAADRAHVDRGPGSRRRCVGSGRGRASVAGAAGSCSGRACRRGSRAGRCRGGAADVPGRRIADAFALTRWSLAAARLSRRRRLGDAGGGGPVTRVVVVR